MPVSRDVDDLVKSMLPAQAMPDGSLTVRVDQPAEISVAPVILSLGKAPPPGVNQWTPNDSTLLRPKFKSKCFFPKIGVVGSDYIQYHNEIRVGADKNPLFIVSCQDGAEMVEVSRGSTANEVWSKILKACINSKPPSLMPVSREQYKNLGDAMYGFQHEKVVMLVEALSDTFSNTTYAYGEV